LQRHNLLSAKWLPLIAFLWDGRSAYVRDIPPSVTMVGPQPSRLWCGTFFGSGLAEGKSKTWTSCDSVTLREMIFLHCCQSLSRTGLGIHISAVRNNEW